MAIVSPVRHRGRVTSVLTAIPEPRRSMRRVPLIVLAALLIAGLLGMHALTSAPMPATASMASSGHASPASPALADQATAAPAAAMSGPHGTMHGSGGCADAMSGGGSTCVSVPTGKDLPALPAPSAASLPRPVLAAAAPTPPPETPRRLALTHLELSIQRT